MWLRLLQDEMGRWQFKNEEKQFSSWKIKKIFMNPDFGKKSFHSKNNYHFEFQSLLKTFTKAIELNFVSVYISHYFF